MLQMHACDMAVFWLEYHFLPVSYIYAACGVRYWTALQVVVGGVGVGRYYRADARVEVDGGDGPCCGATKHVDTA